jgi:Uma2 family endonuclease
MPYPTGYAVPQADPPLPPRETLPTMYDLPSEFPEEPGLPDEFHDLQPQLLSRTLALADYRREDWFTGSDLNLYYDVHHPLWHKRPDWFLAIGVPHLYEGRELRRSYVTWQEGRSPHVVIEFLSPGTESSDLGRFHPGHRPGLATGAKGQDGAPREAETPDKLAVYERYLRVPHYLVYDRRTYELRYFQLVGATYQEQPVQGKAPLVWLPDLKVGLGIWDGVFEAIPGRWLRWCDAEGHWLLTDTEQERLAREAEHLAREEERLAKEEERLAKEEAQQRAQRLANRLRELGIDPDEV